MLCKRLTIPLTEDRAKKQARALIWAVGRSVGPVQGNLYGGAFTPGAQT